MKKLFAAAAAVSLVFFFLSLQGMAVRLVCAGLSEEPLQAVFDPGLAPTAAEAAKQGYGLQAILMAARSLADWRFLGLLAGLGLMTAAFGTLSWQQQRESRRSQAKIHELQAQNRILAHQLTARQQDAAVRKEGTENLAHQLKSSLNSLSLRLELLGLAKEADESLIHMNGQIDAFLRQSTILCNEPDLHLQLVSLKTIVESVLKETEGYQKETKVFLEPGWLYGDPEILERVAEALIVNALRHAAAGPVTIRLAETPEEIRLSVSNHTDRRDVPEIRRYQTEESGHYGIGLHLAQSAARQHGGTLTLAVRDQQLTALICLPVMGWESKTAKFLQSASD